jgi:hypothetical protein
MISLFNSFQKGDINFPQLVRRLEGSLEAGEFRDENFIKQWYTFWNPLKFVML